MTDCFICQHPILEGQKSVPETTVWYGRAGRIEKAPSHLNYADHLPTLQGEFAFYDAIGRRMPEAAVTEMLKAMRLKERERAARIVSRFPEFGNVEELIDRIREGDADDSQ